MTAFARALAAFKLRQPAQVQAETDALVARVLGPLDELGTDMRGALGRFYGSHPEIDRRSTQRAAALPDVPAQPESAIDLTGIDTGNRDLERVPEWQPPTTVRERAPLPIYPQPTDLPPPPCSRKWP